MVCTLSGDCSVAGTDGGPSPASHSEEGKGQTAMVLPVSVEGDNARAEPVIWVVRGT